MDDGKLLLPIALRPIAMWCVWAQLVGIDETAGPKLLQVFSMLEQGRMATLATGMSEISLCANLLLGWREAKRCDPPVCTTRGKPFVSVQVWTSLFMADLARREKQLELDRCEESNAGTEQK